MPAGRRGRLSPTAGPLPPNASGVRHRPPPYVDDPRIVQLLDLANATHKQSMPIVDATYNPIQQSDILNKAIDPNDFELNYEALRYHYSTQVSFSTDVWREAFLFSIHSSGGHVYRIPGESR